MPKNKLELEELRQKGLHHLAELLEGKVEDDDDQAEYDDDSDEDDSDDSDKDDKDTKKEVKESAFNTAVEGLTLNESDIEKMKAVFESEVEARVALQLESINAKVDAALKEQEAGNDKKIADYLDFVVEGWVKDNELEIERQVRVDLAESFLTKLKDLFNEHSLVLESDETLDAIQEAKNETKMVYDELTESLAALTEAKNIIFGLRLEKVISGLTEGMTDTQAERFVAICEDVDVEIKEGIEAAALKLQNLKDVFSKDISESVEEKVEQKEQQVQLESEIQEVKVEEKVVTESVEEKVDPKMASYLKAVRRSFSALNR